MGEQALWDRWTRSKDPRAFEALARRLQRFAFDFARRVTGHDADAEDLAQEALLDLAEAGPSKPAAVSVRAFVGRRIVLGARMLKRAALTRARHEQAAAREGVEGSGEEGADARDALALLDEEDRRAVELRFLHGLSYAEVGHVLGVSEPAARMRVHRALASLRERLGPRAEAMIAALPLFASPRSLGAQTAAAAALAGGIVVTSAAKKIVLVVVLLALAGGSVVLSRSMRRAPAPRAELPQREPVEVAGAGAAPEEATTLPVGGTPRDAATSPPPIPPGKGTVFGRITFEDGEPVRGITVKLSGSPATPATTDDEGRFRIDGEWIATRDLVITNGDALYLHLARVDLNADEAVRVDLALQRGTLLEGVVARGGSPVAGAKVRLQRPGAAGAGIAQGSFGLATTDAEGRFAFPLLPDGAYTLTAEGSGFEPAWMEVQVAPGLRPQVIAVKDARPLRLRFAPVEAFRGRKLLFAIESLEGRPIHLWHNREVDEAGQITVEAPPPGRYWIRQLPGGNREFVVTEADVPEIVVELRGARVYGKAPVDSRVSVGGEEVRTGPEGNYEIALVPAGDAEVRLRIGKAAIERPRLRVPDSGELQLDFDLKGVTVHGRLVAEGDYVRSVSLWRPGKGPFGIIEVGGDGAFAIPFVEPGEYEIWGTTGNLQGTRRRIVVGSEDLDVGDVVVDLGPETPVIVTAPAGTRLVGTYWVWAYPSDGGEHRLVQISLDENGRGSIRLPNGAWRVAFGLGGLQQAEVVIDVPTNAPVRFDLKR